MRASPPPDGYHPPGAFEQAVERAAMAAGDRATWHDYGRSVEARPLVAVTVAAPGATPDPARPLVAVVANIHGNEAISSELALHLLADATAASPSAEAAELLRRADVLVAPCLNPDGRAQAFASLAGTWFWNGARRRNVNGVDLNRNWPWPEGARDHWLPLAGTRNRRLPWYRGSGPLSEPESRSIAGLLESRPPVGLLNLHSAGQILTYPWSSKVEAPADLSGFQAMVSAFTARQGRWTYRSKQSRAWYPIAGSSNDWVYGHLSTLPLTVELAPGGAAVRDEPRRWRWAFWWANPLHPTEHLANDRAGCWSALGAALDHRQAANERPAGT